MQYHNTKAQHKGNKVSNVEAGYSLPTKREFTFEQRLHTDLFFGSGQTKKHIDLVKLGLCFMSLEEALEAIPQTIKKVMVNGKLVETVNKTQENWTLFMLAWRTFHAPNSGIPQMYLDKYQPEITGEQLLESTKHYKAPKEFKDEYYQTIKLADGAFKQIKHTRKTKTK